MKRMPAFLTFFLVLPAAATFATGSSAFAQTVNILHRFQGGTDGGGPLASLVADKTGNLYGTSSDGTIFELSPPAPGGSWAYKVLYNLNSTSGGYPWAAVILDAAGNLYGTTAESGASDCGTVFELTPPTVSGDQWTLNVLHAFAGGADGCYSEGSLTMDSIGNIYGVTEEGGIPRCNENVGCGIVFELSPPATTNGTWAETVLHRFSGLDGYIPLGGLVLDRHGALYGTTFYGGTSDAGIIFRLEPPAVAGGIWPERVLYNFAGGSEGGSPDSSLIFDGHGNLYGTANDSVENGGCSGSYCGRVYELSQPTVVGGAWTYATLWAFTGGSDGANPYASVVFDKSGNLYGTAGDGGISGAGTVFEITPPATTGDAWTETTLYEFPSGLGGERPWGGVVFGKASRLYGTTYGGGINKCVGFTATGCGTVFALQP
jgi:uncharacterized repeat protein (TIGR03803 family)